MPVLLECVLENCACGVVGCDSKEWVFALSGLGGGGSWGGGRGNRRAWRCWVRVRMKASSRRSKKTIYKCINMLCYTIQYISKENLN